MSELDPVLDSVYAFPDGPKRIGDMTREELCFVIAALLLERNNQRKAFNDMAELARMRIRL